MHKSMEFISIKFEVYYKLPVTKHEQEILFLHHWISFSMNFDLLSIKRVRFSKVSNPSAILSDFAVSVSPDFTIICSMVSVKAVSQISFPSTSVQSRADIPFLLNFTFWVVPQNWHLAETHSAEYGIFILQVLIWQVKNTFTLSTNLNSLTYNSCSLFSSASSWAPFFCSRSRSFCKCSFKCHSQVDISSIVLYSQVCKFVGFSSFKFTYEILPDVDLTESCVVFHETIFLLFHPSL